MNSETHPQGAAENTLSSQELKVIGESMFDDLIERKRNDTPYLASKRKFYCSNANVAFEPTGELYKSLNNLKPRGNAPLIVRRIYKLACNTDLTTQASWLQNRTAKYREDENYKRLINATFQALFATCDILTGVTHLCIKGLSNEIGATTYGKKLGKDGKPIASISRVSRLIDYLVELGYVIKLGGPQVKNQDTNYFEQAMLRLTDKAYELVAPAITREQIYKARRQIHGNRHGQISAQKEFGDTITSLRKAHVERLKEARLTFYKGRKQFNARKREAAELQGLSNQELHYRAHQTVRFIYGNDKDLTMLAKVEYARLKNLRDNYSPPDNPQDDSVKESA